MPHFVIDCSENILKIKSPQEIIQKVYDTADATDLFDAGDIKVRINPFEYYTIGNTKDDFIQKLDKSISLIKEQPESFPSSEKSKGLRKCVVTKQTTLFYRFDKEKIKIVTLFDTRQHLKKLKSEIE